jgi:four helix bundle protein
VSVEGLKRLEIWKRSKDFALNIYREVLPVLPIEEKWGLNQQIRRSSTSISANIAEGYGRFYYQDNVRFCYMARGSLEETLSHLVFCHEAGFVLSSTYQPLEQEGAEIGKMLNGYIAYLKASKLGENEPGAKTAFREDITTYITEVDENDQADH